MSRYLILPPSSAAPSSVLTGVTVVMDPASVVVTTGKVETFNGPATITQSDAAKRATYAASDADFNGEPSAQFITDGNTAYNQYVLPDLSALTQGEVFAVLKTDYDAGGAAHPSPGYSGLWKIGTHGDATAYPYPDNNIYDGFGSSARKVQNSQAAKDARLDHPHVLNVRTAAGAYTAAIDQTTVFTTASNTVAFSSAPWFGRSADGFGTLNFSGKLAYLAICSQVQTAEQRAWMHRWIEQRFGVGARPYIVMPPGSVNAGGRIILP